MLCMCCLQVVLLQEYAEGGDLFDILSAAGKGGVVRMEESVAVKTVSFGRSNVHRTGGLDDVCWEDGEAVWGGMYN